MNGVAIAAAGASLAGAIVTVVLGAMFERRRAHMERDRARADLAARYSQPLLAAASSLASRLGNATHDQIEEFTNGGERFREYLRFESIYRIARYLCWAQIISRELRVLDLGHRDRNRELVIRLAEVQQTISGRGEDQAFLLLGGEQAALGELMIERDGPDAEPRCLSYVRFRERMEDPTFRRWFDPLLHDVDALAAEPGRGAGRLVRTRAALNELIDVLDPEQIWVPFRAAQ